MSDLKIELKQLIIDTLDLEDILVCNQLEEFIRFSIDGGIDNLLTEADVFIVNNGW